jgi:hypothetical protein
MQNIKTFSLLLFVTCALVCLFSGCLSEDKSKRADPPATTSDTLATGNKITIDYSRLSLKGRTIGKDVAPYDTVWQTGENEATTFEMTKDAKIEGKVLKAGKYSLYTIPGKKTWTIIFNRKWDQWGVEYKQADDVLRVQVAPEQSPDFIERMKFTIERDNRVLLFWGEIVVGFKVE